MTKINILEYVFDGPHSINTNFNEVAGIYIITKDVSAINKIDIGETENLKERIPNHERRNCWKNYNGTYLWFHHEKNEKDRLEKEKKLRNYFNPPCGEI